MQGVLNAATDGSAVAIDYAHIFVVCVLFAGRSQSKQAAVRGIVRVPRGETVYRTDDVLLGVPAPNFDFSSLFFCSRPIEELCNVLSVRAPNPIHSYNNIHLGISAEFSLVGLVSAAMSFACCEQTR